MSHETIIYVQSMVFCIQESYEFLFPGSSSEGILQSSLEYKECGGPKRSDCSIKSVLPQVTGYLSPLSNCRKNDILKRSGCFIYTHLVSVRAFSALHEIHQILRQMCAGSMDSDGSIMGSVYGGGGSGDALTVFASRFLYHLMFVELTGRSLLMKGNVLKPEAEMLDIFVTSSDPLQAQAVIVR